MKFNGWAGVQPPNYNPSLIDIIITNHILSSVDWETSTYKCVRSCMLCNRSQICKLVSLKTCAYDVPKFLNSYNVYDTILFHVWPNSPSHFFLVTFNLKFKWDQHIKVINNPLSRSWGWSKFGGSLKKQFFFI